MRIGIRGPVRLFTGRDEDLGMLHDSLQRNPKGAVISYITSISGPGGMGISVESAITQGD